jgi:hypothetical protein
VRALLAVVVHLLLAPHGAHGVHGTVTLAPVTANTTRVTVTLAVHDRRARPVHIHGGRCGAFYGLPFGVHLIRGARTSFIVRVPLRELHGAYALDIHSSPTTWIACANL